MALTYSCDTCANYIYDEEYEDYSCQAQMDEDEAYALENESHRQCPYYQNNDEYKIVRKQM